MKATAMLSFFRHAQHRAQRIFGVPRNWLNAPSPEIRSFNTNLVFLIGCAIAAAIGFYTTSTAASSSHAIPPQSITTHVAQRGAFLQWAATIMASTVIGNIVLAMPQFRTPRAKFILCGMALIALCCTTDPREFQQWSLSATFLPGLMASLYCAALDACPPPSG